MVVSSSMGTRSMRKVVSAKESVRARYLPEDLSPVWLDVRCGGGIVVLIRVIGWIGRSMNGSGN